MKKNSCVFIRTLNPVLAGAVLLCVLLVFCMDMWLFEIEAPCKFFVAFGKFFYGGALSFIAAYVFYLVTVHYPETRKARMIYEASLFPANAVVTNIEGIFIDMAKKQGKKIGRDSLSEDIIKELLASTKCYGVSTSSSLNGKDMNWLEYLRSKEETYRLHINEIKPLYTRLDSEFVAAVSAIGQHKFSDLLIDTVYVLKKHCGVRADQLTFGGLENIFLELYRKSQSLRKVIDARCAQYEIKKDTNRKFTLALSGTSVLVGEKPELDPAAGQNTENISSQK